MGLFTFITDAGAKLFGGKTSAEKEAEKDSEKAARIAQYIHELDLPIKNLSVSVDGDKATITGVSTDDDARERAVLAAGNINGISVVQDDITVEHPDGTEEETSDFYTVQSGDSLSKIAKEFYGDPMKYNEIFEANRPMLSDPDKIYPGQTLRIPKQK